jgi:NIMA (never in mitosis gene a)-related kinase
MGRNGLELLKLIRTIDRLRDIPVFMMSSDGENEIVAACLGDGAKDYLVKPVGYQHLKGLKEKVLSYEKTKKVPI